MAFAVLMLFHTAADSSADIGAVSEIPLDAFTSENATLAGDEGGRLNIIFSRTAPTVSVDVASGVFMPHHNAVRLVLENNSACNSFLFTYQYADDEGMLRIGSEKVSLLTRGESNEYYIYTDFADRITQITLSFSGVSSGSIRLMSLEGLDMYKTEEDTFCVLNSCFYDPSIGEIQISGNVKYEYVTKYRKARLVLYALDMETMLLPYGEIPVASIPMSSRFDFSLPTTAFEDRMKGYVVAIVGEDGELLYSLAPRVPASPTEWEGEKAFLKGLHTDYGIWAARANVGLAVVDVDLEALVADRIGEGQLYTLGGRSFYFSRPYVSDLDSEIRKSYRNGMRVFLRLVLSDISTYPAPLADSSEELFRLYACTGFLCDRYSTASRGIVSGLIFGHSADAVSLSDITFKEYTRRYADSLFAVSEAAASMEREVRVSIPISDAFEKSNGEPSPCVFLASLGNALVQRYSENMNFGLVVEGDCFSGEGTMKGRRGFENVGDLSSYFEKLCDAYPVFSETYLYHWTPSDIPDIELLKASLLHGYFALSCEEKAEGFVFSTKAIREPATATELIEVLGFAGSGRGERNSVLALGKLRVDDWSDVIEGYSVEKIPSFEYRVSTEAGQPPLGIVGEFCLWDFSQMGNYYGWNEGDGCKSITMEKNEETNRALAIKMTPLADNNYESELMYLFDEKRSLDAVDAFSFVFYADAFNEEYRITVQVCTDTSISETNVQLSANTLSEVYVNTEGMLDGQRIRCIRIFSTPLSEHPDDYKLLIGSISAYSTTQESEQLEEAARPQQDFHVQPESSGMPEPFWIYTISLVAFVSVILIVTLHHKGEDDS